MGVGEAPLPSKSGLGNYCNDDRTDMTYVSEALQAFGGVDDLEAISDALVHLGVSLQNKFSEQRESFVNAT